MVRLLRLHRRFTLIALLALGLPMLTYAQQDLKLAARAAKVSSDLYSIIANNGNLDSEPSKEGIQRVNLFRTNGDKIAINAVANSEQDGGALLQALQGMGLQRGVVSKQRVAGYLPISQLGNLKNITSLRFARPSYKPYHNVGSVTSQGDTAMRAHVARATYSVNGAGIKVGVLSDSYNNLNGAANGVASGDLPAGVQVLADLSDGTGSDEGRGMAELIYDVAPGSSLAFHTAFESDLDFAQGIRDLAAAGCKVITDDVGYFAEPFFQDGPIAQAVDDVVNNNGVAYFSSAGNSGRSSYQSAYNPTTPPTSPNYEIGAHNFSGGDKFQSITLTQGQQVIISFQWDDPFFSVSGGAGAQTDMDILVYVGGVFQSAVSGLATNTGDDAVEVIGFSNTRAAPLVVELVLAKYEGPDPTIVKWINYGSTIPIEYDTKSSTTAGHPNSARCIAVGAAPFYNTPAYNGSLPTAIIEPFSSAGGTPILFALNGTRLGSAVTRQKPEITAVDGTNTTFFFADSNRDTDTFPNFFGTSAAAPHAAGVAALMIQKVPTITTATILSTLESTALDMDDPSTGGFDTGFDFGTGFGFIQADRALQAISPVTPGNTPPTVAVAIPAQSATVNQAFSYNIPSNTFADAETPAASLLLSVSGLPPGLTFTAPTISGAPSTSVGSPFSVTVTATDAGGLTASTILTITVSPQSTTAPPPSGAFSITGVTTVSCVTLSVGQRQLTFSPGYGGSNGQPISFSVTNELLPTMAPGPYTLNLYTDNPVIILRANQSGSDASFNYNWLGACSGSTPPPPPPAPVGFAIVGATTVSCTTLSVGQRAVTFTPIYSGTNGQPISFSVVNELLPTMAPGPYTLNLYTDNPVITLKAIQTGTPDQGSYTYNWFAACGASTAGARISAELTLSVRVLGNPVAGEVAEVEISGAGGGPVGLNLVNSQGRVLHQQKINEAGAVERVRIPLSGSKEVLLLNVSTPTDRKTIKLIKQ